MIFVGTVEIKMEVKDEKMGRRQGEGTRSLRADEGSEGT